MKTTINKIIDIEAALVQKSTGLLTKINDLSYTEEDPINKKLSDILTLFESTQGGNGEEGGSEEGSGDNSSSNNNPSQNQQSDCYMIDADVAFLTGHYVPHSTYTLNGKPVYYNESTAVSGGQTAFLINGGSGCWKLASYTVDDAFIADWQGYFMYSTGSYPRCSSNNSENPEDCVFENDGANASFWYDGMYVTITKCSSN